MKEINSIDDIAKPYQIDDSFYSKGKNSKVPEHGVAIPEKYSDNFIVLFYENIEGNFTKEARILMDKTFPDSMIKSQVPKIRSYFRKNGVSVTPYRVADPALIKGLKEFSEKEGSVVIEEDNEVKQKVDEIFEYAVKEDVSDIHFEIDENNAKIRMRKQGDVVPYGPSIFKEKGEAYARMIYQVYASNKGGQADTSFNPAICQDGVFENEIDGKRIRVRIATMPTFPRGFQMVCRILVDDTSKGILTLENLGYSYKEINDIEKMNANSEGAIIIAGVTGSGKSTTLKTLIEKKIVDREFKIKVITVEDPPEYTIRGANQVPITRDSVKGGEEGAKAAYLKTMQAAVRSDPDVIMIGEVRDVLSANTLRSATESGHGVFATIHASSIFNIIGRLKNFELTEEVLTAPNFLSGLIYQKLIKKLCPDCSVGLAHGDKIPQQNNYIEIILQMIDQYEFSNQNINLSLLREIEKDADEENNLVRLLQDRGYINGKEAKRIMDTYNEINNEEKNAELFYRITTVCDKNDLKKIKFKGPGCQSCRGSGYSGRMVCAETLVPDKKILEILAEGNLPKAENYWRRNLNGRNAYEDAVAKMKDGNVDPQDIERIFNEIGKE